MKKRFSMLVAIMILTCSLGFSQAQVTVGSIRSDLASSSFNSHQSDTRHFKGISMKIIRNFLRSFPTVINETWYENEFAFIVKFSFNSIPVMIAYDKKGTRLFTIRRYQEKDLAKAVRSIVKTTYYDYKITGVDEVAVPQIPNLVYILHLRDGLNLKTVRVNDNEMELIAEFHE